MVFSTPHTNDAPRTITRLRDMGVEPYLITATVEVSPSEGETLLANNTSSTSVTVLCATPTSTKTPTPTVTKTPSPSPTPTPPNARITPTGTTCAQFRDGTASDLNAIGYNLRDSGAIGNVFPGVGFYFVSASAGSLTPGNHVAG